MKMCKFPKHKNLDRYVITRIISDYQKNKNFLFGYSDTEKKEDKWFWEMYNKSRRARIEDECEAVEYALDIARSKKNGQKYIDLLYLLYWKTPKILNKREICDRLEMDTYEADRFLADFRGMVALKTGRMEILN